MKSKTFCFNKTILKKNFSHFWPIWVLYNCYLLLILPVNIGINHSSETLMSRTSDQLATLYTVFQYALKPFPIFIAAAVAAMAVFSYLYSAKSANMIHAMPVTRMELFATNYLSGLLFLLLPEVFAFIVAVFTCLACHITSLEYLFLWLLAVGGISFFALSLASFVAILTGNLVAMPVYYFAANYLYVGVLYIVSQLICLICYGVSDSWHPGKTCILSPMYYLNNNLRCVTTFDEITGEITAFSIEGLPLVCIYAVVGIVFIFLAVKLYQKRQIECAGDMISFAAIKPVFRWGVAICGGFLLSVFFMHSVFYSFKKSHKTLLN